MLPASVLPVLAKAIDEQLEVAGRAAADPSAEGSSRSSGVDTKAPGGPGAVARRFAGAKARPGPQGAAAARPEVGGAAGSRREPGELCELRGGIQSRARRNRIRDTTEANRRERNRRAKALEKAMRRVDLGELAKEIRSEVGEGARRGRQKGPSAGRRRAKRSSKGSFPGSGRCSNATLRHPRRPAFIDSGSSSRSFVTRWSCARPPTTAAAYRA